MQGANLAWCLRSCSLSSNLFCPIAHATSRACFGSVLAFLGINRPPESRLKKKEAKAKTGKGKTRARLPSISVRSSRATTRHAYFANASSAATEMPPGRPPKRPGEADLDIAVLDGSDAASSSTATTTVKCKLPRIDRGDRSGRADFSSVVKSKLQSYTRTGQACDRCKVCISIYYVRSIFLYLRTSPFIYVPDVHSPCRDLPLRLALACALCSCWWRRRCRCRCWYCWRFYVYAKRCMHSFTGHDRRHRGRPSINPGLRGGAVGLCEVCVAQSRPNAVSSTSLQQPCACKRTCVSACRTIVLACLVQVPRDPQRFPVATIPPLHPPTSLCLTYVCLGS